MRTQRGFTLIEIIGVMAVIAIIAAMATPRIFDAIEDAKITSLLQQVKTLKGSIAEYYSDTGTWPRHTPSHANNGRHNLMLNEDTAGNAIPGWDGPYLEQELTNPFIEGGYVDVLQTSASAYACDIDGDGNQDGSFAVYRIDGVSDRIAKKVSQMLDKDGSVSTGTGAWKVSGRVKRYNGTHASIMLVCLART